MAKIRLAGEAHCAVKCRAVTAGGKVTIFCTPARGGRARQVEQVDLRDGRWAAEVESPDNWVRVDYDVTGYQAHTGRGSVISLQNGAHTYDPVPLDPLLPAGSAMRPVRFPAVLTPTLETSPDGPARVAVVYSDGQPPLPLTGLSVLPPQNHFGRSPYLPEMTPAGADLGNWITAWVLRWVESTGEAVVACPDGVIRVGYLTGVSGRPDVVQFEETFREIPRDYSDATRSTPHPCDPDGPASTQGLAPPPREMTVARPVK